MSRCFPFPPPGYEKEARTYDLDLLKKEKDKERKLKKEKKNREKREGKDKEKKEKDRSEGKHRDKKEKKDKDKHKDKKEKDRDKDKDKSTSDSKPLPKQAEHISVDKASDEKKFPVKPEANTGNIFLQKRKEQELDTNSLPGGKKTSRQFLGYSETVSQNSLFTEPPKDSKFLQQADRGIRDEARGAGKQSVEKFTGADARNDEGMVRLAAKSTGTSSDGKEKIKRSDAKKSDDQGIKNGSKFIGNVTSPGIVQPRIDKTSKPPENDCEKRIEGKEKSKKKESDDRQGDKRKDKEGREKEKSRDKEKRKEEKAKQKSQHKKTEPDKLKEISKDDIITGICNATTSQIPEESIKNPVIEGNPKKRRDLDTNGFLNADDLRPSKVLKPTSSHPPTQNGKILDIEGNPKKRKDLETNGFLSADDLRPSKVLKPTSSHPPTQNGKILEAHCPVLSGRQGTVNKLQPDGKEHRINGIIQSPASSISSAILAPSILAKPSTATVKAGPLVEPPRKLPHPDSKRLSELLTLPKMEDYSDFDDQDWLFHGTDSQSKKPKVGSFGMDEIPLVWSEALQIEPVDICALPYVIPY
ncbi:uncharacterized protein [Euphorbia lathyris]|uniref:uncharacterized protein n=1 Tax=Euphorbia lathyris TaxID=212925 RepID=UPI00331399AC